MAELAEAVSPYTKLLGGVALGEVDIWSAIAANGRFLATFLSKHFFPRPVLCITDSLLCGN